MLVLSHKYYANDIIHIIIVLRRSIFVVTENPGRESNVFIEVPEIAAF